MPERMIRSTERADALQFAGGVDRWRDFVAVKVLHFGERTYLVFGIHRGSLAPGRPDERLVVAFASGQGVGGGFQAESRQGLGDRDGKSVVSGKSVTIRVDIRGRRFIIQKSDRSIYSNIL